MSLTVNLIGALTTTVSVYWSSWLVGTMLYTVMKAPEMKAHQAVGYIGTPAFRQQLATGLTVYCFSMSMFEKILPTYPMPSINAFLERSFCAIPGITASTLLGIGAATMFNQRAHKWFGILITISIIVAPILVFAFAITVTVFRKYLDNKPTYKLKQI